MKKGFIFFSIVIVISIFLYINKVLEIEYNKNIFQYFTLTQDLTEEEIKLLQENQPLIYAGNINEPPLGIYYEQSGQYLGLVVDYINAISIELGTTILSRPMIWDEALESLSQGQSDLCDMIPSDERSKKFAFSDPLYFLKGIAVVLKENKEVVHLNDLNGKAIGVQKGDVAIEYINNMGLDIKFYYTKNLSEALALLDDRKVDVVVGDEPVIRYHLKEISNIENYRILDEPIYQADCVIAVPLEKEALINVINKAIFNLSRKGTINQIEKKWSGLSSSFSKDKSVEKMKFGLFIIMLIFTLGGYLTYIWNKSLKILVDVRTKELEMTKNELQITFDGMRNYLVVIGKDGEINNVNTAFLQYLNINLKDVINKKFEIIEMLRMANLENDKIFEKKTMNREEITNDDLIKKYEFKYNGEIFEMVVYQLKAKKEELLQILVMFIDKTSDKLEAQRIIHSNKMEAIGQLASGIAHELRNPLGVIRNSTFILNDEFDSGDILKLKALSAINNSVNRASKIIDNLLKFSRLTNDGEERINIHEVVVEISQYFKKQLEENKIILNICCTENLNVILNAESFRHILINLISNAMDAMPNGGKIDIQCKHSEKEIFIQVRDNGIGIPEEIKGLIFNPFYTTKPARKGTGLGLYIVYSELQKINGTIKLESSPGQGTTFMISIVRRENL